MSETFALQSASSQRLHVNPLSLSLKTWSLLPYLSLWTQSLVTSLAVPSFQSQKLDIQPQFLKLLNLLYTKTDQLDRYSPFTIIAGRQISPSPPPACRINCLPLRSYRVRLKVICKKYICCFLNNRLEFQCEILQV